MNFYPTQVLQKLNMAKEIILPSPTSHMGKTIWNDALIFNPETHCIDAGVKHIADSSAHLKDELPNSRCLLRALLQIHKHQCEQTVKIWNLRNTELMSCCTTTTK